MNAIEQKEITIRAENQADRDAITQVVIAAFKTMEISNQTEHFIIEALRDANALTLSLVAELEGRIVGQIAFSPVRISDGTPDWYGLGPVAVHPDFQRQGIGKALIREGLSHLEELGAKGCCLVGHPQYYRQFGFVNADGLALEGVPPEVFFVRSFSGSIPLGQVEFHEGFGASG